MKRMGTIALTVALAGALVLPAAADGPDGPPIDPPATVTVNGTALELPGFYAKGIPGRNLAEADFGSADWDQEAGQGIFYLDQNIITVTFATGEIEVNGTVLEGVSGTLENGVTYLPLEVIDGLEGYEAAINQQTDIYRIDVTTPNGDPMMQLAYQIREASGAAANMKLSAEDMTYFDLLPEYFEEVAALFPMNISPDTVLVGKVAEGKLEDVEAALEAYRQSREDTFSWYLPQNLPKVQDARLEVEGDYILFLIAENADAGVELFYASFT